jgi:hypothetical protein
METPSSFGLASVLLVGELLAGSSVKTPHGIVGVITGVGDGVGVGVAVGDGVTVAVGVGVGEGG